MKRATVLAAIFCLSACEKRAVQDPSLPDAKLISQIESNLRIPREPYSPAGTVPAKGIASYSRYYSFEVRGGRKFVWGELYNDGRGELHLVHKNQMRSTHDGGCFIITLLFDVQAAKVHSVNCHGLA